MKTAARVAVISPGKMTVKGRKAIAAWLRKKARFLESKNKSFTKGMLHFRYRYLWAAKSSANSKVCCLS